MSFKAPWWLKNRHFQTVYPTIFRPTIKLLTKQERIELPDGDFLDLNWTLKKSGSIVIVLHGLGGSIKSKYASGILKAIDKNGWRGVFVHFRNCSESANRLKRSYHCGETGDLSFVIQEIRKREPNTPISIVGFSLGANVLLKWLGENPKQKDIVNAIAVSAPFDLKKTSQCLNRGFSKFYQRYLLRKLRILLHKKNKHYPKKQFQQSLNAKT
ncbi:MAG: putative alpha/beta-fold hydrolase, partial [bacterium]